MRNYKGDLKNTICKKKFCLLFSLVLFTEINPVMRKSYIYGNYSCEPQSHLLFIVKNILYSDNVFDFNQTLDAFKDAFYSLLNEDET